MGSSELALKDIEEFTDKVLEDGKIPFMIGGEHLVTLGAVRAALKKYPDLHVIHFDAHADLREEYLGVPLSHACVLRRCHDLIGDGRIHQFCIRSGERAEFRFASEHTDMHKFSFDGLAETVEALKKNNTPIYFTIDLDCLDPGYFPGTGTPEAGGVSFPELLHAILTVTQGNVIAADLNELAPNLDQSGASTALACKITREFMLALISKK
jgi:agmatinase